MKDSKNMRLWLKDTPKLKNANFANMAERGKTKN